MDQLEKVCFEYIRGADVDYLFDDNQVRIYAKDLSLLIDKLFEKEIKWIL